MRVTAEDISEFEYDEAIARYDYSEMGYEKWLKTAEKDDILLDYKVMNLNIIEATDDNKYLIPFCKRRVEIIKREFTKRFGKMPFMDFVKMEPIKEKKRMSPFWYLAFIAILYGISEILKKYFNYGWGAWTVVIIGIIEIVLLVNFAVSIKRIRKNNYEPD